MTMQTQPFPKQLQVILQWLTKKKYHAFPLSWVMTILFVHAGFLIVHIRKNR